MTPIADARAVPIIFVLGSSGVGKSTYGSWIAADLNFLHLEIDQYPAGDGIDVEGLRSEWDAYFGNRGVQSLADAIRAKVHEQAGVVLTYPGGLVLSLEQLAEAQAADITTIILYGTRDDCLAAFLAREQETGRGLDATHWIANNEFVHPRFGRPEFEPFREGTFENQGRRTRASLVEAARLRVADLR